MTILNYHLYNLLNFLKKYLQNKINLHLIQYSEVKNI